ncbi:MAG TPA: GNAT family N-acetyltransferase [Anaerolineales bacterium]|nr:GNAT family N-acetyltransferase [Anaerolineales bacterium]HNE05541.1 GNAT family N-acetyltransferase [Anaerolineales bacterium]HNF94958.1 GNAT family N-acetyltransferase [Anaerolineales bacterium]HNM37110.1 GNAT family N-acetyltransferase [Anaerolineales bacterium]
MNYSLRSATIQDAPAVTACVNHAFGHYVERIGMKPAPMEMDYEHEIREHQVFVVEDAGQVVGSLVLGITQEGFLLDVIAVEPKYWGKGVGRIMLEHAEAEAKQQGFDSIYLFTHEKMVENQALYKKVGYVEYDRRLEMGRNRVYMRKQLV